LSDKATYIRELGIIESTHLWREYINQLNIAKQRLLKAIVEDDDVRRSQGKIQAIDYAMNLLRAIAETEGQGEEIKQEE
jgi:hypothetical protein